MTKIILLRLLETYFRHRWLYLLPLILMTAGAGIYLAIIEPEYIARSVLYVQPQSFTAPLTSQESQASWWVSPAQATTNDIKELLQTDAFVRAIIQKTDLESEMDGGKEVVDTLIEETREKIGVQLLGENQVMIGAANKDPEVALQLSNAVLESYIQWHINSKRAQGVAALAFYRELIDQYGNELDLARQELRQYLKTHPSPIRGDRPVDEQIEIGIIQSKIAQLETREESARDNEEKARLSLVELESAANQTYSLIDAPVLPDKPETSRRELAMKLGIFLGVGLILSVVSVVGAALLDRSFRFPIDVQHVLNLPVLAVIPDVSPHFGWRSRMKARSAKKAAAEELAEAQAEQEESAPKETVEVFIDSAVPEPLSE